MSRDSNLSAKFSLSSLLWIALLCVFLSLGSGLHVKGIEWRECARPSKKGRKRPRLPCCLPFSMHWLFVCFACQGHLSIDLASALPFFGPALTGQWSAWSVLVDNWWANRLMFPLRRTAHVKSPASTDHRSSKWKRDTVSKTFQKGVLQFY